MDPEREIPFRSIAALSRPCGLRLLSINVRLEGSVKIEPNPCSPSRTAKVLEEHAQVVPDPSHGGIDPRQEGRRFASSSRSLRPWRAAARARSASPAEAIASAGEAGTESLTGSAGFGGTGGGWVRWCWEGWDRRGRRKRRRRQRVDAGCDGLDVTALAQRTVQSFAEAAANLEIRARAVEAKFLTVCNRVNADLGEDVSNTTAAAACGVLKARVDAAVAKGVSVNALILVNCKRRCEVPGDLRSGL